MHDAHRKAAEQHELAAQPIVLLPNMTKKAMTKAMTKRENGIRNGH